MLQKVFFRASTNIVTKFREGALGGVGGGSGAGLLTYLVTATIYTCLFGDLRKLFRVGLMLLFDSSSCPNISYSF